MFELKIIFIWPFHFHQVSKIFFRMIFRNFVASSIVQMINQSHMHLGHIIPYTKTSQLPSLLNDYKKFFPLLSTIVDVLERQILAQE